MNKIWVSALFLSHGCLSKYSKSIITLIFVGIPHSNSDIAGAVTPHLYLLQMDSNINLRTSDPQLFPLQFLNNVSIW